MRDQPKAKRKGKRLLVAAIGVATVSYLGAEGCGNESDLSASDDLSPALPGSITETSQEAANGEGVDASLPASGNLLPPPVDAAPPASGNLLPPPPRDASVDALIPSGNLLPPPRDASTDALVTSGNLLPPPPSDASTDALVTSGNLLPPPPEE